MKKSSLVFIILLSVFLLTGCTEKTESGTKVSSSTDTTNSRGTLTCTRSGIGLNSSEVDLNYEVKYNAGYVTNVHSIEKVTSTDSSTLDQYEEAYKNIFKAYKDLDHYTNNVTRTENTVVSDTIIEYDKVDMAKLEKIENAEETIIKNGKVALSDWLTFAEKFGTKCSEK